MKIFTNEILKALPAIGSMSEKKVEEIRVPLKCFDPCGGGSWFIYEYDPKENLAFGYVTGLAEQELGYIDMNELLNLKLRFGLKIERDIHWNLNNTLKEVMEGTKI